MKRVSNVKEEYDKLLVNLGDVRAELYNFKAKFSKEKDILVDHIQAAEPRNQKDVDKLLQNLHNAQIESETREKLRDENKMIFIDLLFYHEKNDYSNRLSEKIIQNGFTISSSYYTQTIKRIAKIFEIDEDKFIKSSSYFFIIYPSVKESESAKIEDLLKLIKEDSRKIERIKSAKAINIAIIVT